jgi:predicted amidohydrolase
MIIYQPHKPSLVYSKKYLHPDEGEFFIPGQNFSSVKIKNTQVGFAICYELSIPAHSQTANDSGAHVYIASVAKFANGVEKAVKTLSEIASKYSMTVLMSNAIGSADNGVCTGNSSVWNSKGELAGQLSGSNEGILVFDTDTGLTIEKTI